MLNLPHQQGLLRQETVSCILTCQQNNHMCQSTDPHKGKTAKNSTHHAVGTNDFLQWCCYEYEFESVWLKQSIFLSESALFGDLHPFFLHFPYDMSSQICMDLPESIAQSSQSRQGQRPTAATTPYAYCHHEHQQNQGPKVSC